MEKRLVNFCILSLFLVPLELALSTNATKSIAPAIYVFGDSMVDAGNNVFLNNFLKADYYPYGIDLNGIPRGRFTNGKTVADFIAEFLGLPLPPPSLSLKNEEKSNISKTGVNYASSGSGILYETGKISGENMDLEEQIKRFESTVKEALPSQFQNEKDLQAHLSKSIFFIAVAGNDYLINYFMNESVSTSYTPKAFAEHLISEYGKKLRKLYQLGARKILFTDMTGWRCSPTPDGNKICDESKPKNINLYNNLLDPMMTKLQKELPGFIFTRLQHFSFVNDMRANAAKYGFKNGLSCCRTNEFGGCVRDEAPCAKREEFVTFDGGHPSQATYGYMAKMCIDGSICKPLSVKMLVDA